MQIYGSRKREQVVNRQSNLTQGRIAAAHGQFSHIRQMTPMCTPYTENQKWLPRQHPLVEGTGNICILLTNHANRPP